MSAKSPTVPVPRLYDEDFLVWTQETARLLRIVMQPRKEAWRCGCRYRPFPVAAPSPPNRSSTPITSRIN